MDFEQAKMAHFAWKNKLANYIKNPDGSLKSAQVSQDNQCDLGKWLHGEGGIYNKHPEFNELVLSHAHFHKCAGDVIKKADNGESVSEEVILGGKSSYSEASTKVTILIKKIQKIVEG